MTNAVCPFMVRVKIPDLNIRKGAGTNTAKTGKYTGENDTIFDIRFSDFKIQNFTANEELTLEQRAYIKCNVSANVKNILHKRAYIKYNISAFGGDCNE